MNTIPKRGRPAGDSSKKREAIALAASELFGTLGYDNSSIRLIAEKAGVDAKLVSHYFGSKASLFAAVLKLPPQADGALTILRTAPPTTWGEHIANALVQDDGSLVIPQLIGVIKSASSDPEVASAVREFYLKQSMEHVLEELNIPDSKIRASALSALLAGFTFSDGILGIPVGGGEVPSMRKKLIANLIQTVFD